MTERIIHNLVQGSDEWAQFRLEHFGASEAAAMLGLSTKVKRNELLHMKYVGTPREFSDWVQKNILDHGHEVEALARPIVEGIIGDDLYPVTCSLGRLSASCDGLTMGEDTAFEHKQWNAALAEAVRAGELPEEHWPQCQQVLLVTGAKRVIFTVSDGTTDNMERIEIAPDEAWFERLRAGWDQFAKDLASYTPVEIVEKPQADAIMALPALAVQIQGEVLASNLPTFRAAAERFIASIKTDLESDEDFANAEAAVKFCENAEKDLEVAKNSALAQTSSIDELMRTVDHIKAQLREKRLSLNKLVSKRKEEIKSTIIVAGRKAYTDHVAALNAELMTVQISIAPPDFVAAAKNKRTLASLHDAIDTAVAGGKIAADAAARDLREKLAWFAQHDAHAFLFRDLQELIQKPTDDFELAVTTRIEQHKQAEEQKALPTVTAAEPALVASVAAPQSKPVASTPWDMVPCATSTGAPTLRLGQINERLAPISLTADGLATLGITHAATDRAAKLYRESDFEMICVSLIEHIQTALHKQAA
ncbi:YqaJ viral recombinase family protein [Pandoraea apista]|uniref:YqaJ viral recombinase family protein n=1 Tax=Pandoraea apista TaxID=93218 RepID=UPI000F67766A|nr:YqaJ viral recombinase family protein [Pandoraea apista]RRW90622.1 endonuclease [Pandoraea apista]RRX00414.1 endonuclease [Pandoraea apista]